MTNIRIEKAKGKGWFLRIGSHPLIALTSLEVWDLSRVLKSTDHIVFDEIRDEIDEDGGC